MSVTTELPPVLNASHRCDACGTSRAYVMAILRDGELYFCAHDWKKHAAAIRPLLVDLIDETGQLTSTSPMTATLVRGRP